MQAVTEIIAPNGYILNSTPEIVKLEAGKTGTVILKNSRKPSLIIKKYDEDTSFPLENAEFSVAKKGGEIVYEGLTDKSGQIVIEGGQLILLRKTAYGSRLSWR